MAYNGRGYLDQLNMKLIALSADVPYRVIREIQKRRKWEEYDKLPPEMKMQQQIRELENSK
jgi:hypothetical protein